MAPVAYRRDMFSGRHVLSVDLKAALNSKYLVKEHEWHILLEKGF